MPNSGGAVRWVVEDLGALPGMQAFETAASSVSGAAEGLYFVPAFTGLGVPDPNPLARGAFIGLAPGHKAGHVARATWSRSDTGRTTFSPP